MSFDALENSIEDGRPLRFYRFTIPGEAAAEGRSALPSDRNFRYTSADGDIEMAGQLWKAIPIEDDGVNQTGDASSDALTIRTTTAMEIAQFYMDYPPSKNVLIAIFDAHFEDPDQEMRAIYVGEITQHDTPRPGQSVFTAETIGASMSREGLRLGWQRSCPYALYDPTTCKVSPMGFQVIRFVDSVIGNVVTVHAAFDDYPAGHFDGGFIEWDTDDRGKERRGIETVAGLEVTLFGTGDGIVPGETIKMYPGCARTTTACAAFGNLDNYGGAPSMQGKSPFDGSPVFN